MKPIIDYNEWIHSQLSIARHAGGICINGESYMVYGAFNPPLVSRKWVSVVKKVGLERAKEFANSYDRPETVLSMLKLKDMKRKEEAAKAQGELFRERKIRKKAGGKVPRKVYQYTMDGEFVKEFPSVASVVEDGFTMSSVSNVCNGFGNHHHGYVWSFYDFRTD